jgi:hypothetical protein
MRGVALLLCVVLATASVAALAHGAPAPYGGRSVVAQTVRAVDERFWTPVRMRGAQPLDLSIDVSDRSMLRSDLPGYRGETRRIPPTAPQKSSPLHLTDPGEGGVLPARATTHIPYVSSQVDDPTTPPYVTHGRVFLTLPGGLRGSCSGTLVTSDNKSVVMTAAHCLLNPDVGRFATSLTFAPGYQDGVAPFGLWSANSLLVTPRWASSILAGVGDPRFDVGAAVLTPDAEGRLATDVFGARGVLFNADPSQSFTSFGYPAAPPFNGQRLISCESEPGPSLHLLGQPSPIGMGCDMTPGSSGGGWVVQGQSVNSVVSFSMIGHPEVQYGPYFGQAALDLYEDAASQPVPGNTPDPSITEPPVVRKHPTTIVLRLSRHLVARGQVGVSDGYLPCARNATVKIFRRVAGARRLVTTTTTRLDGVFRVRIRDRRGRYRAALPGRGVDDLNLCSFSRSTVKRHAH